MGLVLGTTTSSLQKGQRRFEREKNQKRVSRDHGIVLEKGLAIGVGCGGKAISSIHVGGECFSLESH